MELESQAGFGRALFSRPHRLLPGTSPGAGFQPSPTVVNPTSQPPQDGRPPTGKSCPGTPSAVRPGPRIGLDPGPDWRNRNQQEACTRLPRGSRGGLFFLILQLGPPWPPLGAPCSRLPLTPSEAAHPAPAQNPSRLFCQAPHGTPKARWMAAHGHFQAHLPATTVQD